jgi:hypothetical protein
VIEFDCLFLIKGKQPLNIFQQLKTKQVVGKENDPTIKINTKVVNKMNFISTLSFSLTSNIYSYNQFNNFFKKAIALFFFNYNKPIQKKANFTLANLYTYKFILSFLYSRKLNLITPQLLKFFILRFHNKSLNTFKFLL